MFRIWNKLFKLKDLTIMTLKINRKRKERDYYLFPIIQWEDNKNLYSLDMLIDEKGNIIDYFYSYEIQKDVGGMYQWVLNFLFLYYGYYLFLH